MRLEQSHSTGFGGLRTTIGSAVTVYDNNIAEVDGIVLEIKTTTANGSTGSTIYTVKIPALSVNTSYTLSSLKTDTYAYIEFQDLKVYTTNTAGYYVAWSAWTAYRETTVLASGGSGYLTNAGLAPAKIPLFGVPCRISATGSTAVPILDGPQTPPWGSTSSVSFSGKASGGWRFKETVDDDWTVLPVHLDMSAIPSFSCPQTQTPLNPSATTTYDAEAPFSFSLSSVESSYLTWTKKSTSITLLPDLTRDIVRINNDYGAFWAFGGHPQWRQKTIQTCTTGWPDSSTSQTDYVEKTPVYPADNRVVGNSPHGIEAPLAAHAYAHWTRSVSSYYTNGSTYSLYGLVDSFPTVGSGSNWSYLSGKGDASRHVNTNGNPHWSYVYYFPETGEDEEILPGEWTVDGDHASPDLYWVPLRQQWFHGPSLPAEEDTHQRNHIVESPLIDGGFSDWIQSNVWTPAKTHWVGVPRFAVVEPQKPASVAYDSDSSYAWGVENCSISHGSSITVTPDSGKTNVVVELDLGRFDCKPWLVVHICDRVLVNWSLTNVTQVKVYAVSADGTTKVLLEKSPGDGYTTRNETYNLPRTNDAKYAGSWGQDFGIGLVTDTGTDLKSKGQSALVCASPGRVHTFGLLGEIQPVKLRFEIALTGNVTLNYPVFYPTVASPTVLQETGHWADILWPNGPGVRIGQWLWWNGSILLETPQAMPPGSPFVSGYRMSALDALCTKRVLLEGKARNDGLTTEIASIWDSTEGNTIPHADSFATAFWLGPADSVGFGAGLIALVNSFSAVPPLAVFPRRGKDADWAETDGYIQRSWSFCQVPRRVVNAGSTALDLSVGGTVWTAPSAISVSGWTVREHQHAVDNTESGAKVLAGTAEIASVRPWHGWFAVYGIVESGTKLWAANCHARTARYFEALINQDGNVVVRNALYGNPIGSWDTVSQITDSGGCSFVGIDYVSGILHLVYTRDGTVYWRVSNDEGTSFREEHTIMAGGILNRIKSSPLGDKVIASFKYDSGDSGPGKIYASRMLAGDLAWSTPAPIKGSDENPLSVTDDGFDISYGYANGRWVLTAVLNGDTEPSTFVSFDYLESVRKC